MNQHLYSSSLRQRYEATASLITQEDARHWPMGCGGAANAFLVLLGSSMSRVGQGQEVAVGGANRPVGQAMTLGPQAMDFD